MAASRDLEELEREAGRRAQLKREGHCIVRANARGSSQLSLTAAARAWAVTVRVCICSTSTRSEVTLCLCLRFAETVGASRDRGRHGQHPVPQTLRVVALLCTVASLPRRQHEGGLQCLECQPEALPQTEACGIRTLLACSCPPFRLRG